MSNNNSYNDLLIFDGDCLFCNHSVQLILKLDTKKIFTFCTIKYANEKQLIIEKTNLPDSVLYKKNNLLYTESDAIIQIAITLGGIYSLAYLFLIIPKCIRNIPYKLIAKYRYKIWGKTDHCIMITPDNKYRFLS